MTATAVPPRERGITLHAVTKSFGGNHVLRGVTADLPADRIYGLLGANGVGKTTLMALICGHTFRSGGQILIDGEDPVENAAVLRRTCFVHEDQRYNDNFTVAQVLAPGPAYFPNWSAETAERLARRFRWTADREHPTWAQDFSPDGGASWETNWEMRFTREP